VGRRPRRSALLPFLLFLPSVLFSCTAQRLDALRERELAEVRSAFDSNLAAIRRRDVEGYLAGYLTSAEFLFIGPDGVERGFGPFAAARRADPQFPDSLVAGDPLFTWLAPGVVHAAYPYVAQQGPVAGAGWSERVFVSTADGWKVAVTSVIPSGN
jgi:hypothetical protein